MAGRQRGKYVRSDGSDHLCNAICPGKEGGSPRPDRKAAAEYTSVCAEWSEPVAAYRNCGRAMHSRRWVGTRVLESSGADEGEVCGEPVCTGREDVPDGGLGKMASRWELGVLGPDR
uniref:hypothetical protein n=1 Tax=Paenibacillus sp. IHBB 10380 TaxID=1566358 RepID=UPI001F252604|nr:hypothetical protein [Paenibacillus sp. IHBB 10380]